MVSKYKLLVVAIMVLIVVGLIVIGDVSIAAPIITRGGFF